MALIFDEFDWDGEKNIRELINDLIDIEKDGYSTVKLEIGVRKMDDDPIYTPYETPVLKFN